MSVNDFIKKASNRLTKIDDPLESDIEDNYIKHAKKRKCKAYKLTFFVGRGWPDRTTFCAGGKIFFIEFKRKNKRIIPNSRQDKIRKTLIGFGFHYFVCDEIGQAEKILDDFLDGWYE